MSRQRRPRREPTQPRESSKARPPRRRKLAATAAAAGAAFVLELAPGCRDTTTYAVLSPKYDATAKDGSRDAVRDKAKDRALDKKNLEHPIYPIMPQKDLAPDRKKDSTIYYILPPPKKDAAPDKKKDSTIYYILPPPKKDIGH